MDDAAYQPTPRSPTLPTAWTVPLAELRSLLETRSQGYLTVVFVSRLPWSAFRTISAHTTSLTPVVVRLPRLGQQGAWVSASLTADVVRLLERAAPPGLDSERAVLYRGVCAVLYDTVKASVRDEEEIVALARTVWRVVARVLDGGHIQPLLPVAMPLLSELIRDAQTRVVARVIGPSQWAAEQEARILHGAPPPADGHPPHPSQRATHARADATQPVAWPARTGFPAMQAFLLVSAYLASYNPTKTDAKYFVRELGASRRRRRRRGKAVTAANAAMQDMEEEKGIWNRPQFWGPRTFSLERLVAIYHALLADFQQDLNEDALPASAERAARTSDSATELHLEHIAGEFWSRSCTTASLINALVADKLLIRMSPAGRLSAVQYRVNVPYLYVRSLAHSVGFPLDAWLWDWHP
ncbi:hypothetical protein MSPP1_004140 [Malassezia sp. CBS 17886]|nr:hypothetical protein MSPP1_004140 [Malassezia sp. CBS 17886]